MMDEKRRKEWERVKAQSTALLAKRTPEPNAPPQPREPRPYYEDDPYEAWERNMPRQQISQRERQARALGDSAITAAVLNACLAKSADHLRAEFIAMLDERDHIRREALCEALAELLGQERDEAADRLSDETKALRLELTTLQEALAEMRTVVDAVKKVIDSDRAKVIEMPPLRARAN